MPDFTVKCFDAGTRSVFDGDSKDGVRVLDKKEFVAWLKGHTTPVKEISVDSNGDFCITTSAEIAFLWELKTFERKRKLTITNKNDVCLFRVSRIEGKTHLELDGMFRHSSVPCRITF